MVQEAKLIVTEGMKVDYVKQHGNRAQQIAVKLFDADDSGDLKGSEVELFNNCVFKLENDKFTIYDNGLRKDGHGGKIVFNLEKANDYGSGYGYEDLGISFSKTKYGKDSLGYRHLGEQDEYHYGDLCYHKNIASFDEIQFKYGKYPEKMTNAKIPWLEQAGSYVMRKIINSMPKPGNEERMDEWMDSQYDSQR